MADALPNMQQLLEIMSRLRDKENGCPWDVEQDFASILPYTIEEAYEVAEAVHHNDMNELRCELGDLLLQVVFHAQMAKEEGFFAFEDVAQAIAEKMVRRHPHVFGEDKADSAGQVKRNWDEIKEQERQEKGEAKSVLDDVPAALPALMRAEKLQKRASRVGFDWPSVEPVYDKIEEELAEVRDATGNAEAVAEEIGDLLFVVANLARHHNVDPEDALRWANRKFEKRFHYIERRLREDGRSPADSDLKEMDALWNDAKNQKDA